MFHYNFTFASATIILATSSGWNKPDVSDINLVSLGWNKSERAYKFENGENNQKPHTKTES